jgi:hypothetical protein
MVPYMRMTMRYAVLRLFRAYPVLLGVLSASSAYSQSSFSSMSGTWSGNGTVELRGGTKERVRCKATYEAPSDGQSVKFGLVCASDAYKFDLSSSISQTNGTVSGIWFESTHRVGGRVSGLFKGGLIEARAEGDIVTALLTVKTDGTRQTFVMRSPGAQVEEVSIALHR